MLYCYLGAGSTFQSEMHAIISVILYFLLPTAVLQGIRFRNGSGPFRRMEL